MNWADYLLLALIAFSCIAGLMRGLLREVISLLTWVAGIVIAWKYAGLLEPRLGGTLANEALRPWAARVLIFIVVLLIGTAIGMLVTHFVRLSIFSGMDRLLGGVFGLLRGVVMIGLIVILCHGLRLQQEPWWRGSLLMPSAERAANVLRSLIGERKISGVRSVTAWR